MLIKTSCANCGGVDNVTYDWTFEPASANNLVQTFDWNAYSVIDNTDGSISIDVMAFRHVTLVEDYAFAIRGPYLTRINNILHVFSDENDHVYIAALHKNKDEINW